jgi:hypothetical protein
MISRKTPVEIVISTSLFLPMARADENSYNI